MRIELFSRRNMLGAKRWYFRIRAANGQIVAQSEAYTRKVDAQATAQSIRQNLGTADVIEVH